MNSPRRRGKHVWLALLGVIVALVSLASVSGGAAISPAVAFALVLAYLVVVFVSVMNLDLNRLRTQLSRGVQPLTASTRQTSAARRASQRARSMPEFGLSNEEVLVDIGFLINERRRDGRWERRIAQAATYDDGFIQPYVKLHVPPERAERMALVEFEFYDRSGRIQFSHKVEEYLRQGDNLLLCDRQLALRGNEELGRAGTWDLRVKVDGYLVGLYDFSMSSSTEERQRRLAEVEDGEAADSGDLDYGQPVSLEDLLREQARRSSQQG